MQSNSKKIRNLHIPCPKCPSSDAYCEYEDNSGYCFSCKYYKPTEGESDEVFTYEYLPHRGLTRKTLEFYNIKTKVDATGKPVAVGFYYPDGRYKIRSLDHKDFYWKPKGDTSKTGCFGRNLFTAGAHEYIIITEGEYDAPSLYQVTQVPAISVSGSSSAARDVIVDRSFINSHARIYLAFDGDAAGKVATREVARLFDHNRVYVLNFEEFKDANDYLQHGKETDLLNIFKNAKRYLPETVTAINRDSITKILSETSDEGVPYPFPTLNNMTFGMRRGESVLLTAQEGIGKTEVMHAIEKQLLEKTNDNVCAIFLEEPKKRHLEMLAGMVVERPIHLPEECLPAPTVMAAIQTLSRKDDRLYLYNHFGTDDPEILLDTIRFVVTACNVHWVLLDHITMVVCGLANESDERRALDYLSTRLEMMVNELKFGLIIVSHVNDNGQTRGSRYISKVANMRIDLTRDLDSNSSIVKFNVSKNRFSGRTGRAGEYYFDTYTRQYQEISDGQLQYIDEKIPLLPSSDGVSIPDARSFAMA